MMEAAHTSIIRAMMMEAARTSETSVDNYFTRQYIPENKPEQQTSLIAFELINFVFLN
jgi:hypothetical protein